MEKEAEAAKAPEVAVEDAPPAAVEEAPAATKATGPPKVGESIELNGFGGEVQTHSEEATTLAKLLEASKSGVVLFTYPKASTPGCKYGCEGEVQCHLCSVIIVLYNHCASRQARGGFRHIRPRKSGPAI